MGPPYIAIRLVDNPVGKIILNHGRSGGVDMSHVAVAPYDGVGRADRIGLNFTEVGTGVYFDLNGDGQLEQISWTSPSADDAWLSLDRNHNGFIDGGVVASNPSMAGLVHALSLGQPLGDIRLLSLGTGANLESLPGATHDWGIAQWGQRIVSVTIDGVADLVDQQCRQVLGGRYLRVNPIVDPPIEMDDIGKLKKLVDYGKGAYSADLKKWVEKVFLA